MSLAGDNYLRAGLQQVHEIRSVDAPGSVAVQGEKCGWWVKSNAGPKIVIQPSNGSPDEHKFGRLGL